MITEHFVLNKFSECKTELLTTIRQEISTSITSALSVFRAEINQRFTEFKESHTKSTDEKITNIDKRLTENEMLLLSKIQFLEGEIKDLQKKE